VGSHVERTYTETRGSNRAAAAAVFAMEKRLP
jgi:hypothetical protein